MSINIKPVELINEGQKNTMVSFLGIEITDITSTTLSGKMPVDERHIQIMGVLHGGGSVVLAETLGSIASNMSVDTTKYACMGLEINANHIRPVPKGKWVYGTATALHIGKKTHVWEIKMTNEEGKLTCISRITMAVVERFH